MIVRRKTAAIFDFDGLIADTESTDFESWARIFASFGVQLPLDWWVERIGADEGLNPFDLLVAYTGRPDLLEEEVRSERSAIRDDLIRELPAREGVLDWLLQARALEVQLVIASGSNSTWVGGHLERLALRDLFDHVVTRESAKRPKPAPDIYLKALRLAQVDASSAIAIEDSPVGAASALAAGIQTIVVPGPMTFQLDFPDGVLRLETFTDRSFASAVAWTLA
jgi:putative hydrolase of the HAD superfamily